MGLSVENLGLSFISILGDGHPFVSAIIAYLLGAAIIGIDVWITAKRSKEFNV